MISAAGHMKYLATPIEFETDNTAKSTKAMSDYLIFNEASGGEFI